jgi:hypothetical protein
MSNEMPDAAECLEGSPDFSVSQDHADCPCRKTGVHRVHQCSHGTEWWERREMPVQPATAAPEATEGPAEGGEE